MNGWMDLHARNLEYLKISDFSNIQNHSGLEQNMKIGQVTKLEEVYTPRSCQQEIKSEST